MVGKSMETILIQFSRSFLEAKLLYNSVLSFPHSLTHSLTPSHYLSIDIRKQIHNFLNTWGRKISKTVLEIPLQT